jgi:hypothetical protein
MKPSEELIVRLVDEEIAELVSQGNKFAIFGQKAALNVAAKLDLDETRVRQVWLEARQ